MALTALPFFSYFGLISCPTTPKLKAGVEPGTYRLKVRFLGHQDLNTEEVYLEAHKTKNLSYSLKAKNISL